MREYRDNGAVNVSTLCTLNPKPPNPGTLVDGWNVLDPYTSSDKDDIPHFVQINTLRRPDKTATHTNPQLRPHDLLLGFPEPRTRRVRRRMLHRQLDERCSPPTLCVDSRDTDLIIRPEPICRRSWLFGLWEHSCVCWRGRDTEPAWVRDGGDMHVEPLSRQKR